MAAPKKQAPKVEAQPEEVEMTRVMHFYKKDGWYAFDLLEVPKKSIDGGTLIHRAEPDIMPIFINNIKNQVCDFFGI
jgi:hypothetical protein